MKQSKSFSNGWERGFQGDFRVPALKVAHDEEMNEVSVDVSDDPYKYEVLDVSNLPVLITVGQVNPSNEKNLHCIH